MASSTSSIARIVSACVRALTALSLEHLDVGALLGRVPRDLRAAQLADDEHVPDHANEQERHDERQQQPQAEADVLVRCPAEGRALHGASGSHRPGTAGPERAALVVSVAVRAWARLSFVVARPLGGRGPATAVALVSVWHAAAPTWRRARTPTTRRTRPTRTPRAARPRARTRASTGRSWDQLASYVDGDDRIYFQVPHRPYGTLDLHDTVAALGRWYLAPASR